MPISIIKLIVLAFNEAFLTLYLLDLDHWSVYKHGWNVCISVRLKVEDNAHVAAISWHTKLFLEIFPQGFTVFDIGLGVYVVEWNLYILRWFQMVKVFG